MIWLLLACGPGPQPPEPAPPVEPAPAPAPAEAAPNVTFAPCARTAPSPAAAASDAGLLAAREALMTVVREHTGDPRNPWAIVHGMLALGPDMRLDGEGGPGTGKLAIPWIFEEYGELHAVGSEMLVGFPTRRGDIRVEPHTDLVLKALVEGGVPMDAGYVVQGRPVTVADLWRRSVWRTWLEPGGKGSFKSMNDTPWSLQAFAGVAPAGFAWTAEGGRAMTLDGFTDAVVADLRAQTAFMREARSKGEVVKKERQGIFAYTCGGAHLLQGAGFAVARGFGSAESRAAVQDEVGVLFWRLDVELKIYDDLLASNPEYANILLEQRLKFLGHFLETGHKLAALGLYAPDEAQTAALARARAELVATVARLERDGHLGRLGELRADPKTYQTYLDYVGDAAHAVRGIDLASGAGTVCW